MNRSTSQMVNSRSMRLLDVSTKPNEFIYPVDMTSVYVMIHTVLNDLALNTGLFVPEQGICNPNSVAMYLWTAFCSYIRKAGIFTGTNIGQVPLLTSEFPIPYPFGAYLRGLGVWNEDGAVYKSQFVLGALPVVQTVTFPTGITFSPAYASNPALGVIGDLNYIENLVVGTSSVAPFDYFITADVYTTSYIDFTGSDMDNVVRCLKETNYPIVNFGDIPLYAIDGSAYSTLNLTINTTDLNTDARFIFDCLERESGAAYLYNLTRVYPTVPSNQDVPSQFICNVDPPRMSESSLTSYGCWFKPAFATFVVVTRLNPRFPKSWFSKKGFSICKLPIKTFHPVPVRISSRSLRQLCFQHSNQNFQCQQNPDPNQEPLNCYSRWLSLYIIASHLLLFRRNQSMPMTPILQTPTPTSLPNVDGVQRVYVDPVYMGSRTPALISLFISKVGLLNVSGVVYFPETISFVDTVAGSCLDIANFAPIDGITCPFVYFPGYNTAPKPTTSILTLAGDTMTLNHLYAQNGNTTVVYPSNVLFPTVTSNVYSAGWVWWWNWFQSNGMSGIGLANQNVHQHFPLCGEASFMLPITTSFNNSSASYKLFQTSNQPTYYMSYSAFDPTILYTPVALTREQSQMQFICFPTYDLNQLAITSKYSEKRSATYANNLLVAEAIAAFYSPDSMFSKGVSSHENDYDNRIDNTGALELRGVDDTACTVGNVASNILVGLGSDKSTLTKISGIACDFVSNSIMPPGISNLTAQACKHGVSGLYNAATSNLGIDAEDTSGTTRTVNNRMKELEIIVDANEAIKRRNSIQIPKGKPAVVTEAGYIMKQGDLRFGNVRGNQRSIRQAWKVTKRSRPRNSLYYQRKKRKQKKKANKKKKKNPPRRYAPPIRNHPYSRSMRARK